MSFFASICQSTILVAITGVFSAAAAQCRIGDPCSGIDSTMLDPRYPIMNEWAKAGVTDGIPLRSATVIAQTLSPGDSIQAALDSVSGKGGGVILLNPGTYPIGGLDREGLIMRSNVILRGKDRANVVLESRIRHSTRPTTLPPGISFAPPAINFSNAIRAGIEDLTIVHGDIRMMGDSCFANFENCPCGTCDWLTDHLSFAGSRNVWVDNCNVLYSGKCMIRGSASNVTFRDSRFYRAANKGGGNGYIILSGSNILFYNNSISGIRHVTTDGFKNAVFIGNTIEVDMNWHRTSGLCAGNILVERNMHFVPQSHDWDVVTYRGGYASPWALFYRNIMYNGKDSYKILLSHPDTTYKFCDSDAQCASVASAYVARSGDQSFSPERIIFATDSAAPAHGTFYAVKGNTLADPVPIPTLSTITVNGTPTSEPTILLHAGDKIQLTASVPGYFATPESYLWDFGDGSTLSTAGNTVSHEYAGAGFFTPTVALTTREGRVSPPSLVSCTFYLDADSSSGLPDTVLSASQLKVAKLGTSCPTPYTISAQGTLIGDSAYSFRAQGHDMNYGWDRGGFAYMPVSADTFTFTARILQVPLDMSNGKCGVMVREGLNGNERAIDMRYDAYSGYHCWTWFFRFIEGTSISEYCPDGARTSCCFTGIESSFKQTDSIWVRIERKRPRFFLSLSPDGQTWTRLAQKGSYARLGAESSWANLSQEQPLFLGRDTVYIGFSLAGGASGSRPVTMTADKISLRYGISTAAQAYPKSFSRHPKKPGIMLKPDRMIVSGLLKNGQNSRNVSLFDAKGRALHINLASSSLDGETAVGLLPYRLSPGIYFVKFDPNSSAHRVAVCR